MNSIIVIIVFIISIIGQSINGQSTLADEQLDDKQLQFECSNQLANIKTIEQFRQLSRAIRNIELQIIHNGKHSLNRGLNVGNCLKHKEKIYELNKLLMSVESRDVCHPRHIDQLVKYHKQHLRESAFDYATTAIFGSKMLTKDFFRRYALAVSLTCNRNIYANLLFAEQRMAINGQQLFNTDNSDLNVDESSRQVLDEANKISEAIERPDQIELIDQLLDRLFVDIEANFPATSKDQFNSLVDQCQQFATYYETSIKSITKLASVGYGWKFETIQFHANSQVNKKLNVNQVRRTVKKWLDIVQKCDLLLNVRIEFSTDETSEQQNNATISLITRRQSTRKGNTIEPFDSFVFDNNIGVVGINLAQIISARSTEQIKEQPISEFDHQKRQFLRKMKQIFSQFSAKLVAKRVNEITTNQMAPIVVEKKQPNALLRWWQSIRQEAKGNAWKMSLAILSRALAITFLMSVFTVVLFVSPLVITVVKVKERNRKYL